MWKYLSLSHISAGFVVVLVGYSSSAAIIFQAAQAAGAGSEEVISWLWALGIGMGLSSFGLSLTFKKPVLTAWSTPGAALLVTSLSGYSLAEAIGAFLLCSLLITICGITSWFDRLMAMIPAALASAMLAGVLLSFGMELFVVMEDQQLLTISMLLCYLLVKKFLPRYVIPVTLLWGLIITLLQGQLDLSQVSWQMAAPVLTLPEFSLSAVTGVAIPLFIVTMTSQNMPGLAVLKAHNYQVPASKLISWTGITGIILAPFGGFAFNLSAITAAICMGKEADPIPERRYLACIWAGVFYFLAGLFATAVVGLMLALPKAMIVALAGLALLNTIAASLHSALSDEKHREAALITFIVTASGLTLAGTGSAFWGLIAGALVCGLNHTRSTGNKTLVSAEENPSDYGSTPERSTAPATPLPSNKC
ncbi:benzoate/H(+) symporter BenE family transporter [Oceanospirillum sediminis]|uniref:Benzoate/H(+) symporter BenE family transporter n=1 Tax=Oceanospirillum sediminis TaxID=2760088 RepID=A0A839IX35_9GAMM|nr:benzoate/H(+) symporter BenE family transporter [Oceanospirillum sediminis]MBB1489508.1 benzoate/H(+) symporter BenE family transporter [Oceanospirillum sediminis]